MNILRRRSTDNPTNDAPDELEVPAHTDELADLRRRLADVEAGPRWAPGKDLLAQFGPPPPVLSEGARLKAERDAMRRRDREAALASYEQECRKIRAESEAERKRLFDGHARARERAESELVVLGERVAQLRGELRELEAEEDALEEIATRYSLDRWPAPAARSAPETARSTKFPPGCNGYMDGRGTFPGGR